MAKTKALGDKFRFSTSSLLNFTKDSYLERTSRPFYALIFLIPFIAFYEVGTIFLNTDALRQSQVRVVAFVWLKNFLEYLGFGSKFAWAAPPFAVVIILLSLQVSSRKAWSVWMRDLLVMALECIALAVPLIVLSLFLVSSAGEKSDSQQLAAKMFFNAATLAQSGFWAEIVTGLGAGIYEELVFRLILICLLMILFYDIIKLNENHSIVLSVLISAAMFSIYHHIDFITGRQIDDFSFTKFLFRTIAGVYFAVLYAIRGFGITAGAHAFYDIFAVFINSFLVGG